MENKNPYQSPEAYDRPVVSSDGKPEENQGRLCGSWLIVCLLNMIVPMIFGSMVLSESSNGSAIGVLIASLCIIFSGCVLCFTFDKLARTIVVGGLWLAATQMFPLIQVFAGMIGLSFCELLGLVDETSDDDLFGVGSLTIAGGFVLTMITSMILLGVATFIGFIVQRIRQSLKAGQTATDSYPP